MHQGVLRDIAREQAEKSSKDSIPNEISDDCDICKLSQKRLTSPDNLSTQSRT